MADDKGALVSGDWRDPGHSRRAVAPPRVAFGRASELHLRSRPASHVEELSRARSVVSAGSAVIADTMTAVRAGDPPHTTELVETVDGVTASLVRDPLALPSIIRLRQQHEYTYVHSVAVCGWMVALAQELQLAPEQIRDAGLAGLLHDVGKALLPSELLNRSGHYTVAETALVQEHPLRGYEVLCDVPEMPVMVIDAVWHHHERLDGSGFPDGLSGDALGVFARMVAVCDF
jgi:HD-GYP domain-containing protein (c-di-GMP phosphodiesterase class II)